MRLQSLAIGAVVLTAVLAGCTMVPEPAATSPSPEATDKQPHATATAQTTSTDPTDGYVDGGYGVGIPAGGPGDCTGTAFVYIASVDGKTITEVLLPEHLVDMGLRKFAKSEVTYDDQGRVATYTVAAGDVLDAIGKRFCTYDGGLIGTLNGRKNYESIQPGEVLVLNPQAVAGFEYEDPDD